MTLDSFADNVEHKTIFAFATGDVNAPVAVLRISGPLTQKCLTELTQQQKLPNPRQLSLRKLFYQGKIIDEAMVVYFPAPHSYTGEDMAEIHIHGSPALRSLLPKILISQQLHYAQAGEFTKRSLLNGKIDLTAAEAVNHMLSAQTQLQLSYALERKQGSLYNVYLNWQNQITSLLALAEASLDFPDEDENIIPFPQTQHIHIIQNLISHMKQYVQSTTTSRRIIQGVKVVLLGNPNTGKSTLFNFLSGQALAITSSSPGTTRDALHSNLDFNGVPITLIDTAGIRESECLIEQQGVQIARNHAQSADVVLWLDDASQYNLNKITLHPLYLFLKQHDIPFIHIVNKCDLHMPKLDPQLNSVTISLMKKINLDILLSSLEKNIKQLVAYEHDNSPALLRHSQCISEAITSLQATLNYTLPELTAENLRGALKSVSQLSGYVDVESVLERVFSEFCIGK